MQHALVGSAYWIGPTLPRRARLARGVALLCTLLALSWGAAPSALLADEPDAAPTGEQCRQFANQQPAFGPVPAARTELRRMYLTGLCYLNTQSWAEAEAIFQLGLTQDEALRPYWTLRLFHALLPQNKPTQTEVALSDLLLAKPTDAVVDEVRQLLQRYTASELPSRQGAYHRLIRTYLSQVPPRPDDHELVQRQWQLSHLFGTPDERSDVLLRLWQTPRTKAEALQWGDLLQAQRERMTVSPSGAAYVRRARRLRVLRLFARNSEEIVQADLSTVGSADAQQLGRIYIHSLFRLRQHSQAEAALAGPEFAARFGLSPADVLDLQVQLNLRRRNLVQALSALARLEALQPTPTVVPDYYLQLARIYAEQGRGPELLTWAQRLIERFPDSALTGEARWRMMWWHYQGHDYRRAIAIADAALAKDTTLLYEERARMAYWRMRSLERLRRTDEAEAAAKELLQRHPSSYYGLLLAYRQDGADALTQSFASKIDLRLVNQPPPEATAAWNNPRLRPVLFLYSVLETEQARGALDAIYGQPLPRDALEELARLSFFYGQYYVLQRLVGNYFLDALRLKPEREAWPWIHAYPPAYWDLVAQQAQEERMHPLFALAVMREESKFDPDVESAAGAKGLMQLMPPTARQVAERQHLPFDEQQLLNPQGNIPLGVAYLARVLHQFDDDLVYGAAAYNAGPTSVSRWIKDFGDLPHDEFVESIPFEETQRYVKKVIGSFLIYVTLYS